MKRKLIASLILCSIATTSIVGINSAQAFAEGSTSQQTQANVAEQPPTLNGIKVNKQLININYSVGVNIVPQYIVIHDTDNRAKGANAMANRNYFANHIEAMASTHYTIDQDNIIQCLENTWRSWNCGDGHNPLINNSNTIAMELCVNSDNNFDKTVENGIALTKYLMKKYNIPASNVIRHHDVSGKICPKMMMVDRPELWPYFKKRVAEADISSSSNGGAASAQTPTTSVPVPTQLSGGQATTPGATPAVKKGKVYNISTKLNVRSGASTSNGIIGYLNNNDEVQILGESNGWYKINFGSGKTGYVSKSYVMVTNNITPAPSAGTNTVSKAPTSSASAPAPATNPNPASSGNTQPKPVDLVNKTTETSKGKVTGISTSLSLRKGAGTSYSVLAYLLNNTEVTIKGQQGDWYFISANGKEGYASKKYIQVVSSTGSTTQAPILASTSSSYMKNGVIKNVSTNLNVRKGAGTSYSVVGYLLNGTKVSVKSINNGWANILFDTTTGVKEGYINANYLQVVGQI